MNEKAEMAHILAGALAENLQGAPEGAAEYDRRQQIRLVEQQATGIPDDNFLRDLYQEFVNVDLDCIRQTTADIPRLKRLAATFPELSGIVNDLIGHDQTLLEIYLRMAEYDSERLEFFKTIHR
jgi:hypothetical protein